MRAVRKLSQTIQNPNSQWPHVVITWREQAGWHCLTHAAFFTHLGSITDHLNASRPCVVDYMARAYALGSNPKTGTGIVNTPASAMIGTANASTYSQQVATCLTGSLNALETRTRYARWQTPFPNQQYRVVLTPIWRQPQDSDNVRVGVLGKSQGSVRYYLRNSSVGLPVRGPGSVEFTAFPPQ